jgi:hypothetical protein
VQQRGALSSAVRPHTKAQLERSQQRRFRERLPDARAAYQESIENESTRAGKEGFINKGLAELSNLGEVKRLGVQNKIEPKEKYHAIHDADDPRRLSRR